MGLGEVGTSYGLKGRWGCREKYYLGTAEAKFHIYPLFSFSHPLLAICGGCCFSLPHFPHLFLVLQSRMSGKLEDHIMHLAQILGPLLPIAGAIGHRGWCWAGWLAPVGSGRAWEWVILFVAKPGSHCEFSVSTPPASHSSFNTWTLLMPQFWSLEGIFPI